jgi:hypothetical protein
VQQRIYSFGHFFVRQESSYLNDFVAHALRGYSPVLGEERCVMLQEQDEPLEATLADLIVALTEEADRLIQNRRQAHNFVAYVLLNILSHSAPVSHTWH